MKKGMSVSTALGLRTPDRRSATFAIVAVLGAMSILTLLVPAIGQWLIYQPQNVLSRPWTVLTYPLALTVGGGLTGPIFTLFLLLWTFQIGDTVESEQGKPRYLAFWAAATVLPALLMLATGAPLIGPSLPIAALTVLWAARRPNAMLMLFGIVPIAAKWIGALSALGIFAEYYRIGGPVTGLLSIVSLGVALAWAMNLIPGLPYIKKAKPSKQTVQREIDFMKEVAKRKDDRAEKERLRKLLEGGDDPLR